MVAVNTQILPGLRIGGAIHSCVSKAWSGRRVPSVATSLSPLERYWRQHKIPPLGNRILRLRSLLGKARELGSTG